MPDETDRPDAADHADAEPADATATDADSTVDDATATATNGSEPTGSDDSAAGETALASDALLMRERTTPEGTLVSVCDAGLIGTTHETADGEVSLEVTESFYGGKAGDRDEAAEALADAQVANLVGDRAVTLAVEVGLVDPANVLDLDGTPHAQFMRL